jgi:hypothetical protein
MKGSLYLFQQDTLAFTSWLVLTAVECGILDGGPDRGLDVPLESLMHYTNELARMVSAQKIFPRRIWEGLQRAIALLSGCVAWFQRQYDSAHHTDAEPVC